MTAMLKISRRALNSSAPGTRRPATAIALLACATACLAMATSAAAKSETYTATYSATASIPVPPASDFHGNGGGDGWAVALSETAVYNVFHHQATIQVACHYQANAEPCFSPETITETGTGANFATSGQPGLHLDQHTGKLYLYATRTSDGTAGVVCIDTTLAPTNPDPFCGFTALTPVGEAPLVSFGISGASDPVLIGNRWYAYSFVSGVGQSGAKNALMCFDVSTDEACAGQPYIVGFGAGNVEDEGFPSPSIAAIGSKVIIPLDIEGTDRLACFDDTTQSSCGGSWPVTLPSVNYASDNGAPFPLLDATGKLTGLCLPTGTDQCFNLEGEAAATPAGMSSVIEASSPWNGPALVLGPRVYVPNGNYGGAVGDVECFDYSKDEGCEHFPKTFPSGEFAYLYTVNPDPQRPTCIWVNSDADGGTLPVQIESFDAYTGEACGEGTIRVLASQFVVPQPQCTPANYVSLRVLQPARSSYTSGSIGFDDGDGNPILGLPEVPLDETGTASLSGLELNTPTGLPQFLFTINGETGKVGTVEATLTWEGDYDASCVGEGTTVSKAPEPKPTPSPPIPATGTLPSKAAGPKACTSKRDFKIHIQHVKQLGLVSAVVKVDGKNRKTLKGKSLSTAVNLVGLPQGTFTVEIVAHRRNGRTLKGKRVYHTCVSRLPGHAYLPL
ncbi:MAG TPA: hypothetical protein VMG80_04605 [Solirubrobacteraceae bacterium]|nr:hypothetical protein [Solirubrobacteraceae bacterium]